MAKILVVEDDQHLAGSLEDWLMSEHHTVDVVTTGTDADERLRFYNYDLIVMDWDLPGMSGVDVCKKYRAEGGTTVVIMLTGKDTVADKTQGLDSGADDYLTKPFHPGELSARIRALLRRPREVKQSVLQVGDVTLDPANFKVTRDGKEVMLLPKEFALLEFLMRHPNEVFSTEALMERVWSSESEASPDTVRVHITKLRNKMDVDGKPSHIKTLHRMGYRFEP